MAPRPVDFPESTVEVGDHCRMHRSLPRRHDKLSLQKLDGLVLTEDALLDHPQNFRGGEAAALEGFREMHGI